MSLTTDYHGMVKISHPWILKNEVVRYYVLSKNTTFR